MRSISKVQQEKNTSYVQKVNVEEIFENAIDMANKQFKLKAMEIAREALIFAKKTNNYLSVYIHGFLAVLHMEMHKTSSARIHVYNAINTLNKDHLAFKPTMNILMLY